MDWKKIKYEDQKPVYYLPINSAITFPVDSKTIKLNKDDKFLTLKGYAIGNMENGLKVKKV